MLSHVESVTRVFYARADLDLIVSSPANLANVFAVRVGAIALSVIAMGAVAGDAIRRRPCDRWRARWFAAYGVVIAIGLSASALAIAVTLLLFRLIGARDPAGRANPRASSAPVRDPLQIAAILSAGTLSDSDSDLGRRANVAPEPKASSGARAARSRREALLLLLAASLILLGP